MILAEVHSDPTFFLIEVGLITVALALLARLATRFGLSAIPLFLVAGLALGEGGLISVDVSEEFISLGAEIGVLLLLLALGLEYTGDELREGLKSSAVVGVIDAALNFTPGLLAGLILGWEFVPSVLLGGVTWASSSGVIAKVLSDLDRLGNRETPSVLNLLVVEDLAMAIYLPVVAAMVAGEAPNNTVVAVVVAVTTVGAVLWAAMRWGHLVSTLLKSANNEALILAVVGMTMLTGGLLQRLQISAAIGAFLVGLAISGPVQERASNLVEPLRDLFAAIFFLFFAIQINPSELPSAVPAALVLLVITATAKIITGWIGAKRMGIGVPGRMRAGTALIARGEFSIVIASLGAGLVDGPALSKVAAAYVLMTAIIGPAAAKNSDVFLKLLPARMRTVPAS